jgi:hypothetical protein
MSSLATPKLKAFARRLLIYEAAVGTRVGPDGSAAFRVCSKLREPLTKLIGVEGFRTLMSRASMLAAAEVPWLRVLQIKADGSLAGLGDLEAKNDLRAVTEGEAILAAQLLGLLVTFIGPPLTLRLLHDIWPKMDDLKF